MGRAAAVIARHGNKVCSRNSWGDAVFVVAEDAATAARIALEFQEAMGGESAAGFGVGAGLRVGAHLSAVVEAIDPVTQGATFFGRAVNMTARIEPVASTGEIHVIRQFGAILALENPGEFALSYVGRMELAKNFGEAVLYRLDREAGRT